MKSFLIVGLGSFGHHLCRAMARYKCELMIADKSSENLEDLLPYAVSAKVGDCTNPEVLRSFGIPEFDACFVCVGNNFQESLEITSLLKELGAKKVFSKADEDVQAKFLLRNGADHVIYPELSAAEQIAVSESSDNIFNCVELTSEHKIYEINVLPSWIGRNMIELKIRSKYNLSVLAIRRGSDLMVLPSPDTCFEQGDHLMVLGHIRDIEKVT
ncbi:MAG: TrkA family potassium uptake protein [Oscillospiraceae bacterium]|nr:TrkA family potassium uptake protein [Oscillospiraceae bacterium]